MADTIIAAQLKLEGGDQVNTTVKSFKKELREANEELVKVSESFGELSPQAIEAARRVAALKDQIADAKEVAGLFDPGAKFQAFGNVIRTVTGGFSALTGTMALFGAESEDVQKTIAKLQAALAITEGVNTIADSIKDFDRLKVIIVQTTAFKKLDTLATKAAAAVQKLFKIEVDATSSSFKLFKGAIAATGIGLLVVALGEAVSLFQEYSNAAAEAAEAQEEFRKKTIELSNIQAQASNDFSKRNTDLYVAQAQAAGKSEDEIFAIKQAGLRNQVKIEIDRYTELKKVDETAAKDSLKRIDDLNAQGQIAELNNQKRLNDLAKNAEKERAGKAKEATAKEAQQRKERQAAEFAALEELQKLRADADEAAIKDDNVREIKKIENAAEQDLLRIQKLKISEQTRSALIIAIREKEAADLAALDEKIKKEREEADAKEAEKLTAKAQAQVAAVTERANAIDAITKELDDVNKTQYEVQLESLDEWYRQRYAVIQGNMDLEAKLTEDYEKKKADIERSIQDQRMSAAQTFFGNAAALFGKNTVAYKVFAIAEATIATYRGAADALAAKTVTVFDTALKFANVGAIIAAGIANVAKIAAVKIPGGGGGGGVPSTAGINGPLTPQAPQIQQTALDANSLNQIGSATTRSYVLEADVTSNQERLRRLNRAARLGG